jgi:5-methylcytosine-specific restriction endonuclease McrA
MHRSRATTQDPTVAVETSMKGPAMAQGSGRPSLRERIIARDEGRCAYCGEVFPEPQLTIDHVEPRMRGGDQSEGNLVTACRACNTRKGSAPAWAYLADRPQEREMFLRHATAVWPRLRRAIEEAARRERPR